MAIKPRLFHVAELPKNEGCLIFWASRILYFGKNLNKLLNTSSVIPCSSVIVRNRSQGAAWTI